MLSHLAASEGQSQQALSNALGIHRSAVVALVDDLEQRGLAERRRDPVDRRAYTLYLTPAGRDCLPTSSAQPNERDVELLSALNASERSQLISLCSAWPNRRASRRAFIRTWSREKATIAQRLLRGRGSRSLARRCVLSAPAGLLGTTPAGRTRRIEG